MILTGFAAIEFAEKQGLKLKKKADHVDGPREGLSIAEAEAVASDDPSLIWLEVDEQAYYDSPPTDYQPER